jgi:CubicO group peptidase (beta-lactamase class C family)
MAEASRYVNKVHCVVLLLTQFPRSSFTVKTNHNIYGKMAEVQGECDARFSNLKELLRDFVTSVEELGASICVNIDGTNVVDIWGGWQDVNQTQPWTRDTLTVVWSITKNITNLAALMLIDRGLLDPYEKVSKYWPEFAANGKENVEVRHFMSHSSGVPSWDPPITFEEICDVPKATAKLAEQAPWWTPGTSSGYHLVNQGHLIGELIRRVTGKSLKEYVESEITGPLGADFHIGARMEDYPRIGEMVPPPQRPFAESAADSIGKRAGMGSPLKAEYHELDIFRGAAMGACNGFGNARSVARTLCAISLGGAVDGHKLLKPETINLIFKEQTKGVDLVLGAPLTFGIGFGLPNPEGNKKWIPDGKICYWGGWGGSIAIMDTERRMTITYTMNRMEPGTTGSQRTEAYVRAIYDAL